MRRPKACRPQAVIGCTEEFGDKTDVNLEIKMLAQLSFLLPLFIEYPHSVEQSDVWEWSAS